MEDKNFLEETLSAGKNHIGVQHQKRIRGTILDIIPELDEKYIG